MSSTSLASILRNHVDPSLRAALDDFLDLEEQLGALLRTAQAAWPDLEVDLEEFLAAVGRRLEEPIGATVSQLRGEDLLLAVGCGGGDPQALAAFEREILPKADGSLRHAGASPDEVDEVRQQLRERLFVARAGLPARIESYAGRGSLVAWVRVAAVRTLQNLRRGAKPTNADDDALLSKLVPADDPELTQLKETYRSEFRIAFAEAVAGLSVRQRTLLRQHWVDGLVSEELGRLYGTHRATASRWLVKAQQSLVAGTQRTLAERLGVDDEGAQSVLRLIQSRFDASVHRLLADDES